MNAIVSTSEGARRAVGPVPRRRPDGTSVRLKAASPNRADQAGRAANDGKVIGFSWAGEVGRPRGIDEIIGPATDATRRARLAAARV